jgi:hypothetical protein
MFGTAFKAAFRAARIGYMSRKLRIIGYMSRKLRIIWWPPSVSTLSG